MTSRRIWITRARPGAEATARRVADLGHEPLIAPLIEVRFLSTTIDLTGIDALAFTSRNAVEAFAALSAARALPVYAVGDATAAAARSMGFETVRSADGDLTALAILIQTEASGLTILNPTAADPAGDLSARVGHAGTVRSQIIYETVDVRCEAPEDWDAVLIHSPRAARVLIALAPPTAGRAAIAISEAAAAPLKTLPFPSPLVAARPTEDALLAALSRWNATALGNPESGV